MQILGFTKQSTKFVMKPLKAHQDLKVVYPHQLKTVLPCFPNNYHQKFRTSSSSEYDIVQTHEVSQNLAIKICAFITQVDVKNEM